MELEHGEDHYAMTRHCEGCGQKKQCQVPWAELYCLQYGQDPHKVGQIMGREDVFDTSWVYDGRLKCFHPNYQCTCDRNPIVVFNMTPKEAESALRGAGRNGVIGESQKQAIRTISPIVRALAEGRSPHEVAAMYRNAANRRVQGGPPVQAGVPIRRR
jgi:hypothetical protein